MSWTNHLLMLPLISVAAAMPLGNSAYAQPPEQAAIAWVEMQASPQHPDLVEIVGHAQGLSETNGRFSLSVTRSGRGGTSNSAQSGQFHVKAGEAVILSRNAINVPPGSGLDVRLTLYVGDKEIFSAELKSKS